MKRIAMLVALALGCSHVVPVVKDCGQQAVLGIIDDVNTALAIDSWRQGLAALVGTFGLCAVEKAVQLIAGQASGNGRYDDLEQLKAERAKQWLSEQK